MPSLPSSLRVGVAGWILQPVIGHQSVSVLDLLWLRIPGSRSIIIRQSRKKGNEFHVKYGKEVKTSESEIK